jgi:predicted component of type VI protein secretion system
VLRCVDISVLKDPTGIEIKLNSGDVTIGRGAENVVPLNAHGISRNHAKLYFKDGAWQVEDLGSTNGTRVNNSQIERCALADGDTVAFGRVCYKFHVVDPKAGASSVVDLDLGAAHQTIIMRPAERAPEAAAPPPAAEPGAEQIYDTGARNRVSGVSAKASGGKTGLTVGAIVLILVAGGAAAYFLGYI